jgi:hypothetical protein
MATFKTSNYTGQENAVNGRSSRPNALKLQSYVRRLTVNYTCVGTEVTADLLNLAFPRLENCKLIPEQSRITNPTSGASVIIGAKLQKVNPAGTAVDLSAVADVSNNSVTFARITDGSLPAIDHDDYLRILLSTTAATTFTMAAGQVISVELALECPEAF